MVQGISIQTKILISLYLYLLQISKWYHHWSIVQARNLGVTLYPALLQSSGNPVKFPFPTLLPFLFISITFRGIHSLDLAPRSSLSAYCTVTTHSSPIPIVIILSLNSISLLFSLQTFSWKTYMIDFPPSGLLTSWLDSSKFCWPSICNTPLILLIWCLICLVLTSFPLKAFFDLPGLGGIPSKLP